MQLRRPILALYAALLLILAAAAQADDKSFTGKVKRVKDGDTIVVLDQDQHHNVIRLSSIDAPEKGRTKGEEAQPFGERARKHLVDLVQDKVVRIEWKKYDGWGRIVGRVWLDDVDVNLEQIKAGLAWAFREYLHELPETDQEAYLAAEEEARRARQGLWQEPTPEPPWQYRRRKREGWDEDQ